MWGFVNLVVVGSAAIVCGVMSAENMRDAIVAFEMSLCAIGVFSFCIFLLANKYTPFWLLMLMWLIMRTDAIYCNVTVFPMPKNSPCSWRIVFDVRGVCFGVSNAVERVCF